MLLLLLVEMVVVIQGEGVDWMPVEREKVFRVGKLAGPDVFWWPPPVALALPVLLLHVGESDQVVVRSGPVASAVVWLGTGLDESGVVFVVA